MNAIGKGEVRAILRDLVIEIKTSARELAGDRLEHAALTKDIGLDSLDLINLLFRCEERFKCSIPAEDVDQNILTFGKFAEYLEGKVGK